MLSVPKARKNIIEKVVVDGKSNMIVFDPAFYVAKKRPLRRVRIAAKRGLFYSGKSKAILSSSTALEDED